MKNGGVGATRGIHHLGTAVKKAVMNAVAEKDRGVLLLHAHLRGDAFGVMPVVVVPIQDKFTGGVFESEIAKVADGVGILLDDSEFANAGIGVGQRFRAVIDDQ